MSTRVSQMPRTMNGKVVRQSVRIDSDAVVGAQEELLRQSLAAGDAAPGGAADDTLYRQVISEASRCVGSGAMEGAFYEEWDAQLLIKCNDTTEGQRLVLFLPGFLSNSLSNDDELDRALRYFLLTMDAIAMSSKYVFVYAFLGMNWSGPALAQRLRLVFDILPAAYVENLHKCYVLLPDMGIKFTLWTFYPWLSSLFWDKIEYVHSITDLVHKIHPTDSGKRTELRRRFPLIVHRKDAALRSELPPEIFGLDLSDVCGRFSVDFTDKTTGKYYPRLPAVLIFICEPMEREGVDDKFHEIFDTPHAIISNLIDQLNNGEPIHDDEPPGGAYWCALKLWLDCLPQPLMGWEVLSDLLAQDVRPNNMAKQREFILNLITKTLSREAAYSLLYLVSFLNTMCRNTDVSAAYLPTPRTHMILTPASAARVFTPSLMRAKMMTPELWEIQPWAESLLETLIRCAEEPELWTGTRHLPAPVIADSSDSDAEL